MAIRPRIQRGFVDWLETARPRLLIQPYVTRRRDDMLHMAFAGLTPAIGATLSRYDIDVWVEWEGYFWDLIFSHYVSVAGRRGAYTCAACPADVRTIYASREALWRGHLFEPFLDWINDSLATASALALFRSGGMSWVKLVQDLGVPGQDPPEVVIPLRTSRER